jgi:hypothetical protein
MRYMRERHALHVFVSRLTGVSNMAHTTHDIKPSWVAASRDPI